MADLPPLPSPSNCLTPAIDVLVGNPPAILPGYGNPARLEHINYGTGRWSDVLQGWKAQATVNLRRVADEMMQARLPLASGKGLRELAASKFFANIVDIPTRAIGVVIVQLVSLTTPAIGGVIPAGTRFRRNANPTAQPVPIQAADFVTLSDVHIPYSATPGNQFSIPIQCVSAGTAGNVVVEYGHTPGSDLTIADKLGVGIFTVVSATCAGGGTSFSDDEVRAIAGAQPQGRRGPTEGAIYAGSYLATGVRHVAVFEDLEAANTVVFVADESWGSDTTYWQPAVLQQLQNGWSGFGCSLNPTGAGLVSNVFLNIAATVQLRSNLLLQQTAEIQAKIVQKLQDYLTQRPDWWMFRQAAMRGVIARADPRILTCTSITLTDRFSGVAYSDPPVVTTAPAYLIHWAFNSFLPAFSAPL